MADVAAAVNAIATAIRGIAPPPQGAAPQSVSLTPFTIAVTEDFRVFREQLESSIALAQVPNAQQFGFLKLHLQGGALNYFLESPTANKNTYIRQQPPTKTLHLQERLQKTLGYVLKMRELEGICSEPASEIVRKHRINSDRRYRSINIKNLHFSNTGNKLYSRIFRILEQKPVQTTLPVSRTKTRSQKKS